MNENQNKDYIQEQLKHNGERISHHLKSTGKGLYSVLVGLPKNTLQGLWRAAKLGDMKISEEEFLSKIIKKDPSFLKKTVQYIEKGILRGFYILLLSGTIGYMGNNLVDHKKEKKSGEISLIDGEHQEHALREVLSMNGKPQYGLLTGITGMDIAENDEIETRRYERFLQSFDLAQEKFQELSNNKNLGKYLHNHENIRLFLPLVIKETRLNEEALSSSGAYGYFQILGPAEKDINNILSAQGEQKLSPGTSAVDNIVAGVMYFNHMENQIKNFAESKKITLSDDDLYAFTLASYNFGINKLKVLRDAAQAKNRDEFANYITKDLMKINKTPRYERDENYGIKNYYNRFDKGYLGDKTKIFHDPAKNIILTKEKGEEGVRYAELILAIGKQLDDKITQPKYIYSPVEGQSLFAFCKDLEERKEIKNGSISSLSKDILLDNGISDAKKIHKEQELVLTNTLREKYSIAQEYNYSYDIVPYDKEKNIYLRSMVDKMIKDKSFVENLKYFEDDFKDGNGEVMGEIESVIRQSVIDAIIAFNKAHRYNRNENYSSSIYIPSKGSKYYDIYMMEINKDDVVDETTIKQSVEKIEETVDEIKEIGSIYVDKEFDRLAHEIISISNHRPNTIKMSNTRLQESAKKHGYTTPKGIIIHGTESKDNYTKNPHSVSSMTAHYYIHRTGEIVEFTANPTKNPKEQKISEQKKIVRLNHAGLGNTSQGYARADPANKTNLQRKATYDLIGIEVQLEPEDQLNDKQYKALRELIGRLGSHHQIPNANVLTHSQVASSKKYGRGRKIDPLGLDYKKLGLPVDNHQLIDWAVVSGAVSPNMTDLVRDLKKRGVSDDQIKKTLYGLNESIKLNRKIQTDLSKNQNYTIDKSARKTLEEQGL